MGSFDFQPASPAPTLVVPISGAVPWRVVISQGGTTPTNQGLWHADAVTANGYCNDPASIFDSTRVVFQRRSLSSNNHIIGTTLRLRVVYPHDAEDTGEIVAQSPVVRVFGGNSSARARFAPLRNLLGDMSVELRCSSLVDTLSQVSPLDEPDPWLAYWVTDPENDAHAWDCDGYEYFIVAVELPITLAANSFDAFLQAKFV